MSLMFFVPFRFPDTGVYWTVSELGKGLGGEVAS
jgi:hypothetical protein